MSNIFTTAERMMAMSDDDWLRHANLTETIPGTPLPDATLPLETAR